MIRARPSESSINCRGGIVEVGDSEFELLGKCGEPALRDTWPILRGFTLLNSSVLAIVEEWTYNFGPTRFLMRVRLEGGTVGSIKEGGYGYSLEQLHSVRAGGLAKCEPSGIDVGDIKIDLLARCGVPATRDQRIEQRDLSTIPVEVWIYDLGPQRFVCIVTLENGAVTRVESGGYGFAR